MAKQPPPSALGLTGDITGDHGAGVSSQPPPPLRAEPPVPSPKGVAAHAAVTQWLSLTPQPHVIQPSHGHSFSLGRSKGGRQGGEGQSG